MITAGEDTGKAAGVASSRQPFRPYHALLLLLIGMSVIFDGFDGYTLGLAVPSIAADWGLRPSAFATATAVVTVFTLLGSAIAGFVGDRIGRKRTLILATFLYGAGSLIAALATDMAMLMFSRAMAGLGMGGALVTAVVSVAEHAPSRQRSLAITIITLGVPLGHALAGATAAYVLDAYGWRSLFLIGALIPAAIALLHAVWLPETPTFMSGRPRYRVALERYCRRVGATVESYARAATPEGMRPRNGAGPMAIFGPSYRADTLLLWLGIGASLLITYSLAQWLPSLMARAGATPTIASQAIVFMGMGQLIGGILSAPLVYWMGSRLPMRAGSVVVCLLALVLAGYFDGQPTTIATLLTIAALASANGLVIQMYHTLGPTIYPSAFRGAGTGIALAVGRMGAVVSAYTGAWAMERGGAIFFGVLATAGVVQLFAFGLVKGHTTTRG